MSLNSEMFSTVLHLRCNTVKIICSKVDQVITFLYCGFSVSFRYLFFFVTFPAKISDFLPLHNFLFSFGLSSSA